MQAFHGTAALFTALNVASRGSLTACPGAELATFFALDLAEARYYAGLSAEQLADDGEEIDERILVCEIAEGLNLLVLDGEDVDEDDDLYGLIEDDRKALRHARIKGFDGVSWPQGNATNAGATVAIFDLDHVEVVRIHRDRKAA